MSSNNNYIIQIKILFKDFKKKCTKCPEFFVVYAETEIDCATLKDLKRKKVAEQEETKATSY